MVNTYTYLILDRQIFKRWTLQYNSMDDKEGGGEEGGRGESGNGRYPVLYFTKQTHDCGNCSIPDTAAWLHCGDLVAHHIVADDIVTITDVQAFFRYGRRQQKVLLSSLESLDDPLLLILSHANYNWRKLNE